MRLYQIFQFSKTNKYLIEVTDELDRGHLNFFILTTSGLPIVHNQWIDGNVHYINPRITRSRRYFCQLGSLIPVTDQNIYQNLLEQAKQLALIKINYFKKEITKEFKRNVLPLEEAERQILIRESWYSDLI